MRSRERRTLLAASHVVHRGAPAGTVGHYDPAARGLRRETAEDAWPETCSNRRGGRLPKRQT